MYIKNGDCFLPTNENALDIHDRLPAGNYMVKYNQQQGLFFQETRGFELPPKLYGDTASKVDRIIRTYTSRSISTGVLLMGEKGSGKTLLVKLLAERAKTELNMPVILINSDWCGEEFNKLIQETPESIVIFDEFEKIYQDRAKQQRLLTLLDGTYPAKKLYLFTINDRWGIEDHLYNRPGRIFYSMNYTGVDDSFIVEYCNDKLEEKAHIPKLLQVTNLFSAFNFDMLQSIVEEMNRYKETPLEALKFLNIQVRDSSASYTVELTVNGVVVHKNDLHRKTVDFHPLAVEDFLIAYKHREVHLSAEGKKKTPEVLLEPVASTLGDMLSHASWNSDSSTLAVLDEDEDEDYIPGEDDNGFKWTRLRFNRGQLIQQDFNTGSFVFDNRKGAVVKLTKAAKVTGSYYDMLV